MQLTYRRLNIPLEFTFTISRGSLTEAKTVYIELQAEHEGRSYIGMGEAVPAKFYGEDQDSVCAFYDRLIADNTLGDLDPLDMVGFEARMAVFEGNGAAKSALDMAMYDLKGKIANQPVWQMLGLDATRVPKSSYTIGIADLDTVRHKTEVALSRGYDILKVKLGSPEDMACLKLIRSIVDDGPLPLVTIRVDANAAWTLVDAMPMMAALHEMGVEFVEEPLRLDSSQADYEALKAMSPVMLMADESCRTLKDITRCSELFGAINLKHTKTGGLTEAMRMILAARAFQLKIMLGCFTESSLSISAFAQLAPMVDYADLDGALLTAADPFEGIRFEGNTFHLSARPGLGVIERVSVQAE